MNNQLVHEIRGQVAEHLSGLSVEGKSEFDKVGIARTMTNQLLDSWWSQARVHGSDALTPQEEFEIIESVLASLFGLGRLQRYIDDPEVENIDVNGCDIVWVSYSDGSRILVDPICDSDDELVDLIRMAGSRMGLAERRFDSAHPELDLRLPDGTRLSAVMSVCERPSISLRRHRYVDLDLGDLVQMSMFDEAVCAFLEAAVKARKNIIVSGAMNSGKTTVLRALASCIPPSERLVTIEQALELGLDKLHKRHPNCIALEAREANIEGAGEIGMSRLVRRSLRMNADRVIVGEVLGDEVIPMLNAMSQGRSGSMCTIHSNSSAGVFRRIASYAAQSPERLGLEATNILIAGSIDFVVHIDATHELFAQPFDQLDESGQGISAGFSTEGEEYFPNLKLYRRVTSIREVIDAEGNQVVSNEIWRPSADGVAVRSVALQHRTQVDLEEFGYRDQSSFATSGSWE